MQMKEIFLDRLIHAHTLFCLMKKSTESYTSFEIVTLTLKLLFGYESACATLDNVRNGRAYVYIVFHFSITSLQKNCIKEKL